jgi:hypothetical protein
MFYSFYVSVHARPPGAAPGATIEVGGKAVCTLRVLPEELATTALARSFEAAIAQLEGLERIFCEGDGAFVWTSPHGEPPWQVDGNLYDRDGRLLFVDLKGTCPGHQFDRLLSALGWPETTLVFQLTREAVFLDEEAFRQFAARG